MTVFLISFGGVLTVGSIIWILYVFFKNNLIEYLGFTSIRRKYFRHKLKDRRYVTEDSISKSNAPMKSENKNIVKGDSDTLLIYGDDETTFLVGDDETTLLAGNDETTLL